MSQGPNEQTRGRTDETVSHSGEYAAVGCCRVTSKLAQGEKFPACAQHGDTTWGWIPPTDWLVRTDKLLHDSISRRYPKAIASLDRALVIVVDGVLQNPLFGLILFLILGILAVASGDYVVWTSILAAWAITFLWLARADKLKALTNVARFGILGLAALVLGLGFIQFGGWAISESRRQRNVANSQQSQQVKPAENTTTSEGTVFKEHLDIKVFRKSQGTSVKISKGDEIPPSSETAKKADDGRREVKPTITQQAGSCGSNIVGDNNTTNIACSDEATKK
jgi:hypothetical protein